MCVEKLSADQLAKELTFSTSRAGGPGGQNVNKVNSKVTLRWDIGNSIVAKPEQKERLLVKLKSSISAEGILNISCSESRSQLQNKETALEKFSQLLDIAFREPKVRKKSKPTKSALRKKRESKERQSEKKQFRKKIRE